MQTKAPTRIDDCISTRNFFAFALLLCALVSAPVSAVAQISVTITSTTPLTADAGQINIPVAAAISGDSTHAGATFTVTTGLGSFTSGSVSGDTPSTNYNAPSTIAVPGTTGTITVTSNADSSKWVTIPVTVNAEITVAPGKVGVTTALPAANVNTSYATVITRGQNTGTGLLSFSVNTGSALPGGLSLSSTGDAAVLSGTPTTAGSYTFTLKVSDQASKTPNKLVVYSLSVGAATSSTELSLSSYGTVYADGTHDDSATINAAFADMCTMSVNTSVHFPAGTYDYANPFTRPSGCTHISIDGAGATILRDPANANQNWFMIHGQHGVIEDNFLDDGVSFDGNAQNGTYAVGGTDSTRVIHFIAPSNNITFRNMTITNTGGTGITFDGQADSSLVVGVDHAGYVGSTSFYTDTPLTTLKPGAGMTGYQPNEYFVTAVSSATSPTTGNPSTLVTLNKPLTDAIALVNKVRFTDAFSPSSMVASGATTITAADVSQLSVGQTIYDSGSNCIASGTRITHINVNTSVVTISPATTCSMGVAHNFATYSGFSSVTFDHVTFSDIGYASQRNANTVNYTTVGTTSSGSTSITFNCVAATSGFCTKVGLIPGDMARTVGLPPGMPSGDLVVSGPTVGSGVFTVTFQDAVTATIPDNTSIPFAVGELSGDGFAIRAVDGAWFANNGWTFTADTFSVAWSSNMLLQNLWNVQFTNNHCDDHFQQIYIPTQEGSACLYMQGSVNATLVGNEWQRATGQGVLIAHPINLTISADSFHDNVTDGLTLAGGHDIQVGGNCLAQNNGQALSLPIVQQYATGFDFPTSAGINFRASQALNTGTAGQVSNVFMANCDLSDTQGTPTQQYGLQKFDMGGVYTNVYIDPSVTGTGNLSGFSDSTW